MTKTKKKVLLVLAKSEGNQGDSRLDNQTYEAPTKSVGASFILFCHSEGSSRPRVAKALAVAQESQWDKERSFTAVQDDEQGHFVMQSE